MQKLSQCFLTKPSKVDETATKLKMTVWKFCGAQQYTCKHTHKGACTYTSTNTHAHQIGSRHMGQSVSQPAELTNCMLKIVTHVGGSRTPRRRTTAWLCRRAADQTDVCILPSTKKKVQYLGMLQSWFLVLTKCPTSQQTNTALLNQQCLVHGYMEHTSHP